MKKKYLITGIAGSGKSTICKQLRFMGYETHGIEDIDGMFAMYRKGTKELFTDFDNADLEKIRNSEWLCDVDKLKQLIAKQTNDIAFYCGIASNMDEIIPLFSRVIVLSASSAVLHGRLFNREGTDDMGNTEVSRQEVLGWKDWWEEEMKDKTGLIISADGTPAEIAQLILQKVS